MSESATPALELRGLRYSFGDTVAVDDLDLTVDQSEVFGLLGPNGAGKTTTIRLLTTLLPVRVGTARVLGLDVTSQAMAVRRVIGYVPQALSADPALTGRENVALFARLFDAPRRRRKELVAEVIDAMGLGEAADRLAATYSGGMVRRLELAQALISSPRLLVLDEPTIGLDPVARAEVWERITAIRERTGMTVLVTTHYMDEAAQYCDRVALMRRGGIRAMGPPDQLVSDLKASGVAEENGLDGVFRHYTGDSCESGGFRGVRATRRTARRLG